MCGRYTLYSTPAELGDYFSATVQVHFDKSYNIAPTSTIAVLIAVDNERIILPMRWGLIPAWHQAGQKSSVLNNAKLETIASKPSFRSSFKNRRCLILVNGFYEWDATTQPKQPYYFSQADQAPFALAGIWDRWVSDEKALDSCCIITEPANELVATVHERMPAIILPKEYDAWLDTTMQDPSVAKKMASRATAYSNITHYPVTPKMNRVAYNSSHAIEKIDV